ncbi:MAG TPA: hypothetical protein VGJ32_11145 [Solirubrobacteraceae bacterium]
MAIAIAPRTIPSVAARQAAPAALAVRAVVALGVAAGYALLGAHLVIGLDATAPAALDRLARADLVWHGAAPKLAALGFGAPPLGGLALVPLAVSETLASSLAALPILGGLCGAVTVVALDRALARCGLRGARRVPLVAAFALNPLVAFQFTTGTPAALELALLALALRGLVGWANHADPRALLGAGTAFAAAVLTRYELAVWAVVAGLLVAAALAARGAPREEVEGSATAFYAPAVAALAVWTLLGAVIAHAAFGWARDAFAAGAPAGLDAGEAARRLGELLARTSPLAVLALGALLGGRSARRDAVAAGLAALIAIGAAAAAVHAYAADTTGPLALAAGPPLLLASLVGAGWAQRGAGARRQALWWATLALLLIGGATAWRALEGYRYQGGERAWARALRTGDDQHTTAAARAIARAVRATGARRASVLADEAGTGAAIVLSERPAAFLTHAGAGDARWSAALRSPAGRVGYVLAALGDDVDRARPGLLDGRNRGLLVIAAAGPYVLARVVR